MWPPRPPDPQSCWQAEQLVLQNVNRLLTEWNQPPMPRLSRLIHDVDAILLTSLPALDPYSNRRYADYYGIMPLLPGRAPEWPDVSGLRVFAYLKPFPALPKLLELLGQIGQPTLVYLGPGDRHVGQTEAARNVRIVSEPVDMELVRRQTDCAILHGGHGSTLAMLLAGKPILQLPLQTEQAITSAATAALGAGTWANPIEKAHELPLIVSGFLENLAVYSKGARQVAARYSQWEPEAQLDRLATLRDIRSRDGRNVSRLGMPNNAKGDSDVERFRGCQNSMPHAMSLPFDRPRPLRACTNDDFA